MSGHEAMFQPGMVALTMDIPRQSFRYWRKHLDPLPERKVFDKETLFAYRLLASIIQDKHIPVKTLEKFDLDPIFHWKKFVHSASLQQTWAVLCEDKGTIEYVSEGKAIDSQMSNLKHHAFPLKPIYDKHIDSFI